MPNLVTYMCVTEKSHFGNATTTEDVTGVCVTPEVAFCVATYAAAILYIVTFNGWNLIMRTLECGPFRLPMMVVRVSEHDTTKP